MPRVVGCGCPDIFRESDHNRDAARGDQLRNQLGCSTPLEPAEDRGACCVQAKLVHSSDPEPLGRTRGALRDARARRPVTARQGDFRPERAPSAPTVLSSAFLRGDIFTVLRQFR